MPNKPRLLASAAAAFLTGAAAVLVFHQPTLALLHAAGLTPLSAYPMRPTNPLGAPVILSLTFWGGVWSILIGGSPVSVGMLNALLVNGVWGLGLGLLWRFIPGPLRFATDMPRTATSAQ